MTQQRQRLAQAIPWGQPTAFMRSHCLKCKAGWTRTNEEGKSLTVCLLDRAPILPGLSQCSRFELGKLDIDEILQIPPMQEMPEEPENED